MCFRFSNYLTNGYFKVTPSVPTGWTHIVMNYLGPTSGQGIRIYYNGNEVASDTTKTTYSYSPGDGRIVVGRRHTDRNQNYASVQVDELIFFNQALSDNEVQLIYNAA